MGRFVLGLFLCVIALNWSVVVTAQTRPVVNQSAGNDGFGITDLRISGSTVNAASPWVQSEFPTGYIITGLGESGKYLLAGAATTPPPLPYAYIFSSTDSGSTWILDTSIYVQNWYTQDSGHIVSNILFTPSITFYDNGNTLFAGISQVPRGAIYRSTDNGLTWSDNGIKWPESDTNLTENISCFYSYNNKLFAGTARGVFVSTDDGLSWSLSSTGMPDGQYDSSGVHAPALSYMIGIGKYLSTGVYRSGDGGKTWSTSDSGLTNTSVDGLAKVGGKLFLDAFTSAEDTTGGVFASTDSGSLWYRLDIPQAKYALSGVYADNGHLFTETFDEVLASSDTGQTWSDISYGTPVWPGQLLVYGNYLFADGGGIWRYPLDAEPLADTNYVVDLASFTYAESEGAVTLHWQTSEEGNNAGFNVLRKTSQDSTYTLIASYKTDPALVGEGAGMTNAVKSYTYIDSTVERGRTYSYELQSVSMNGETKEFSAVDVTGVKSGPVVAKNFALFQNYPNPFNPTTNIEYHIAKVGFVTLRVYDMMGQLVKTLVEKVEKPGSYEVTFDAAGLASGVYFYQLTTSSATGQSDRFVKAREMILLK